MRYPVMTEKHLADRWQVSLKTLRRWRLDGERLCGKTAPNPTANRCRT